MCSAVQEAAQLRALEGLGRILMVHHCTDGADHFYLMSSIRLNALLLQVGSISISSKLLLFIQQHMYLVAWQGCSNP
jgi:hypothetical protein